MKHFDVIILGAGPGGLFAAREAGRRGLSAVLLEAQDRAGRKLSMAGGGMGNGCHGTSIPRRPPPCAGSAPIRPVTANQIPLRGI